MELFGLGHSGGRRRPVRTILVVDDSRTNLNLLGRRLGHLGYLTVLCDNGAGALDLITARGFDLVVLDMVMPRLSGLHVLREIRGNLSSADLPVIMLTSRSDAAVAVEGFKAGADDHLAKPFALDVLEARIERVLSRARRLAELKRSNATLDARIATRAVELGELKAVLAADRAANLAERQRLAASIQALKDEVDRLNAGTSAAA